MKPYTFRLARVRDLRARQLEIEQARLEPLLAERRALESRIRTVEEERLRAAGAPADPGVTAGDLAARASWRSHLMRQRVVLAGQMASCAKKIEAQVAAIRQAERRVRLLDRLAGRQRAAWQAAADREVETLAAELYLARLHKR
jgi:flagellar export protein FliJ